MTAAVCFADPELGGPAGPGTEPGLAAIASSLARQGLEVHLLACGEGEGGERAAAELAAAGVSVHRLAELSGSPPATLQRYGGDHPTVVLGEEALEALERLQREHRFGLVEFPDAGGLGMRSVQAKRSGDAFADLRLAVRLQRPAFWCRTEELEALAAPRELKLDYCERYAFEHADLQLSASRELLDRVRRRGWRPRDDAAVAPDGGDGEALAALYADLAARPVPPPAAAEPATVTVAIAHYNHDRYLPGTLASLAAQTRPPDQVIVIDDGSTSEAALRVFAEQEERYPEWTFVREENAGPGAARNLGLELATGTCFLPFDSDNLAAPGMLERLVGAMEHSPSRAATACHNLAFTDDDEIAAGRFAFRYSPTGGPRILACLENVYGDTCSIFRTETLRSVGGFEINRWSPTEDWETFVKLAVRGLEIDVLPRPLFYYRTGAGGRLQALGTDRATKLRLRDHLIDRFFREATLTDLEHRQLFECMQAFDEYVTERLVEMVEEQRRYHEDQMAQLAEFGRGQLQELREFLEASAARETARADAEAERAERERQRAEAAERDAEELAKAIPGGLVGRMVRWQKR